MPPELDHLLNALRSQPVDRPLGAVADGVRARLADTAAARRQTWRLRAAAFVVVLAGGTMASASTAAAGATQNMSPFTAWSSLAPSTLLESPR